MVRGRLPGTVQVVALKCRKVEILQDLLDLEAGGNLGRVGRKEGSQQVVLVGTSPERVELSSELIHEPGEVPLVLRPDHVAGVAFRSWPLPVQVEAVEDAGSRCGAAPAGRVRQSREGALDEQVDAAGDELFPVLRKGRVREELGPGPTTE